MKSNFAASLLVTALTMGAFAQARPESADSTSPQTLPKAADRTVFGIELGKPLALPECEVAKRAQIYTHTDQVICFERDKVPRSAGTPLPSNEKVLVRFPLSSSPRLVKGGVILALIINSNVEGMGIDTLGLATMDEAMETLTKKYGQPSAKSETTSYNATGAQVPTMIATWKFSNLSVFYQSVTNRISSGMIQIDTPIATEARNRAMGRRNAPEL